MKVPSFIKTLKIIFLGAFITLFNYHLSGQTRSICEDGDCSKEISSIKLDDSSTGDERIRQFKAAYLKVKSIKEVQALEADWKTKYDKWELGGSHCLRLYHLEGALANEYFQNPDFKAYIDKNEKNPWEFTENGFQSSRKALNLLSRMKGDCDNKIKKSEGKNGPFLVDLPPKFRKMGEELGYFDKEGRMLKPLSKPGETPAEALQRELAGIPGEDEFNPDINKIADEIKQAEAAVQNVEKEKKGLGDRLKNLFSGASDLLSKVADIGKTAEDLKNQLTGNSSEDGLLESVDQILKDKDNLQKQIEDFKNTPNDIQEGINDLNQKVDDFKDDISQKKKRFDNLKNLLGNILNGKKDAEDQIDQATGNINDVRNTIDQLRQQADDLKEKIEDEKNKTLSDDPDINKAKDDLLDKIEDAENMLDNLKQRKDDLENATKEVKDKIEGAVNQQKEAIADLKDKLKNLPNEDDWKKEIDDCEEEVQNTQLKTNLLTKAKDFIKTKLGGFLEKPRKILGKIVTLASKHEDLLVLLGGRGGVLLKKVIRLAEKRKEIKARLDQIIAAKNLLDLKASSVEQGLQTIHSDLSSRLSKLTGLKNELAQIVDNKENAHSKLDQTLSNIEAVNEEIQDLLSQYETFDQKEKCEEIEELEERLDELSKQKDEIVEEIGKIENDIAEAEKEEEILAKETEETEKEVKEFLQKEEELQEKIKEIKEEFDTDVTLEPVKTEEWAESFQVERPYWDAVFHPDNEVVDGYVGRYFQIRLKDADQNVKLLFGPGKYFMEKTDFRDTYGTTIGAFVTEALHYLKKADEGQVKLFVQGSADKAGHNTFRGNLDERYLYDAITVLPQKADKETFSSKAADKEIPKKSFNNTHLPDLRGNYLREMIKIYSRKLDPILLEGSVKEANNQDDRNAIIYLFFPDELLAKYEDG